MTYDHFSDSELRCRCGCGRMDMDENFMKRLVALRKRLGFPMRVTSAYRCPAHDAAVGGSSTPGEGPHALGRAVDIALVGERVPILLKLALGSGFTGFGLRQKGPWDERFIHLDDLSSEQASRPRIWTY